MDNVIVSEKQQRDLAIHTHVSFSLKPHSHSGCHITLSSSLCYTVDPCWLSILNTVVYTCPYQTP